MHQIGNTFTRLEPVIEFTEESFQFNPLTVCVIGEPPERFAVIHSQGLLNAWYKRLQRCVAEPVQVEQRRGHRRVQDLGSAIFEIASDGTVHAYKWAFNENDRPALVPMPDHTVIADGVPYQSLWMNGLREGALRALKLRHPGQAALCKAYILWAHRELEAVCWTPEVQARVRERIAKALALEPDLLAVATQIQLSEQPRVPVRLDAYNRVVCDSSGYRKLLSESPQLIFLYALLVDDLDKQSEVTAAMRALLRVQRIRPAMWRLLTRDGTQWMAEFLAYQDFVRQTPTYIALELLEIAQAFGTEQLMPNWLLHAMMQTGGTPNAPNVTYVRRLKDLFPLCARLGTLAVRADETAMALLQEHAHSIFNWACDHLAAVPAQTVRRASLKWLIGKVQAQEQLDAKKHQCEQAWALPYRIDLGRKNLTAVILDSAHAVWHEGQLMRHCADNYVERCAKGELLMVSLRDKTQSRPLATVAFTMKAPKVQERYIAGFANKLVTPEVQVLADKCRRQLQLQRSRMNSQQSCADSALSQ